MEISLKDLKNVEITTYETGFTVWVKEKVKCGKKYRIMRHWIIDGSCFLEEGSIKIGSSDYWKVSAEYDKRIDSIIITRRKK